MEVKIKGTQREVSQLSELQKGETTKVLKKYSKLSISEALETAKKRLTALDGCLKRYTRDVEARRINRIFTTEPSEVYSQWEGNKMRTDLPRGESELYWKVIWEKEASNNTSVDQWT